MTTTVDPTTDTASPASPAVDIPYPVAAKRLTGAEAMAICAHFRARSENLDALQSMVGAVWAYECRRLQAKVPWADVEGKTLEEYESYFAPESEDSANLTRPSKERPID